MAPLQDAAGGECPPCPATRFTPSHMSLSRNQRRSLETLSLLERHYGHRVDAFVARGTCDYKTCVRHDLVYFVPTEGTPGVLLVQLPGLDVESAAMAPTSWKSAHFRRKSWTVPRRLWVDSHTSHRTRLRNGCRSCATIVACPSPAVGLDVRIRIQWGWNSFGLLMAMAIVLMGTGIAYFYAKNKIPIHINRFIITKCGTFHLK